LLLVVYSCSFFINQIPPLNGNKLRDQACELQREILFALFLSLCMPLPARGQNEPSKTDPWLDIGIEHRTRYETLDHRFRLGEAGSDQQLPQRTRLHLEIKRIIDPFAFVFEFEDARIHLNDSGSTVNTTMLDQYDITRAYLSYTMKPLGKPKLPSNIYVGRQSFDLGSRRLFARNRFRNTTNAFDMARWTLGDERHWQLTTFLSRPVLHRLEHLALPEHTAAFWGTFLAAQFTPMFKNEFYYFGLRESLSASSSKRRFSTLGTRLYKDPALGLVSYEIEGVLQFGKRGELDHPAHFEHISADYTFNTHWSPMQTGRYDYASGTEDPKSLNEGTFDTLAGARRFEWGPTGIYGPPSFAQTKIRQDGRLCSTPRKNWCSQLPFAGYAWRNRATSGWGQGWWIRPGVPGLTSAASSKYCCAILSTSISGPRSGMPGSSRDPIRSRFQGALPAKIRITFMQRSISFSSICYTRIHGSHRLWGLWGSADRN
jgi:hypothetical protein